MQKHKTLTTEDVQKLFAKFAEPVMRAATTPNRREAGIGLAKCLWLGMLTGEETEMDVFNHLETKVRIEPEGLEDIKKRYYRIMKPSITGKELSSLKEYFKLQATMEF